MVCRDGQDRRRLVDLPGAAILKQPAAIVVLVEAEDRIALEDRADDGGEAWSADHDEVVAVEVQLAAEGDVLRRGLQLQVAGQVGEQVEGGKVLLGDDGPSARPWSWWMASRPWPSPRQPRAVVPSPWLRRWWTRCVLTAPVRRPSGCPGAPTTPTLAWSLPPRTAGHFTRRRFRACSFARPSELGCGRSDSTTSGTRSGRSCWPAMSHPKVVSEMLGHATIALTLDTYSHVIPSLQQEAASVVAAAVLDPASTLPEAAPKGQVRVESGRVV
jgi:hypothetical protein